MHHHSSPEIDDFASLLGHFPPGIDLDGLAREHHAIQRVRKIKTGADVLRLALVHGPGGLSLRATAGWSAMSGQASLSNPAVKHCLDKAVPFLQAVMQQLLVAKSSSQGLHFPGRTIRIADGSCISKPGSKGTDWRVHGVYDLGTGGFSHLELTDGKGAESLTRGAPIAGEIRLADRYYGRAKAWQQFIHDSRGKADLIVRMKWNSFRLSDETSRPFELSSYLAGLPGDQKTHEINVTALVTRGVTVPIRIIIQHKPPEAAAAAIKQMRAKASRNNKTIDPRSLIAAGFLIIATSLPAAGYPATQVLAAYRLRWQIELAFKRLKPLIHIDKLPTFSDDGTRSWRYPHLILALLCDDLSQDFLASFP